MDLVGERLIKVLEASKVRNAKHTTATNAMNLTLSEGLGLRYLRVARSLMARVVDGEYKPHERLPRRHDLAREYRVSFTTIKHALDILEQEGYVVRKAGQGTYASLPDKHPPVALVVDDDQSAARVIARAVESSGWESVVATSGQAALEEIKRLEFDLILLDLVMPGMNGVDTFREIREIDRDVQVVVATAYPPIGTRV